MLNGNQAPILSWTDGKITVKVPQALQASGELITVLVFDPSNNPINVSPNQFQVALPVESTAGTTGGDVPPPDTTAGSTGGAPDTSTGGTGGDPTSSGSTGGTSGGSTGTTGVSLTPPKGYASLLPDTRAAYVNAVSQASGPSAGQLAIKAYALASVGKLDDAKQALIQSNQKLGDKSQGVDVALFYLAQARVVEKLNPDKGDAAYAAADEKANAAAPGFAFNDIAIARFKISQGKWGEARALLTNASQGNLSAAEKAAVSKMMQQVQSRSQ
jgi:hypothetical protein